MPTESTAAESAEPLSELPIIRAELTGSDTCTAAGLTVRSHAPALTMCRRLVEAGHHLATRLEVYRGVILALSVRSIGEGAKLAVKESTSDGRPRFVRYRPPAPERGQGTSGGSPPIAPNETDDKW